MYSESEFREAGFVYCETLVTETGETDIYRPEFLTNIEIRVDLKGSSELEYCDINLVDTQNNIVTLKSDTGEALDPGIAIALAWEQVEVDGVMDTGYCYGRMATGLEVGARTTEPGEHLNPDSSASLSL